MFIAFSNLDECYAFASPLTHKGQRFGFAMVINKFQQVQFSNLCFKNQKNLP